MEIRRSDSIAELATALALAQMEFKPIVKDKDNPLYNRKYADLNSLVEATRPALAKNGLSVMQFPATVKDKAVTVTTMLVHSSGEFIAHDLTLPAYQQLKRLDDGSVPIRFDAQTIGIATTYGRRYGYGSILSLAADDDDGNGLVAEGGHESRPSYSNGRTNGNGRKEVSPEPVITTPEHNAFWAAAKKSGKNVEDVRAFLAELGIDRSDQMLKRDYASALEWALEAA